MSMSVDYQQEFLDNSWRRSWEDVFGTKGTDLKDQLIWMYSNPNRYYHNISHLIGSLQTLKEYHACVDKRNRLELAIWLHDAVCNPIRTDNEVASVEVFYDHLYGKDICITEEIVLGSLEKSGVFADVSNYIRATQHKLPIKGSHVNENLICDIDLVTLGADEETFNSYCFKIRREYKMFSDNEYYGGRLKILHDFLDRGFIYRTDFFKARYEEKAIQNLTKEIDRIRPLYKVTMK
jgi:predicted metal-dependent HD superfamily phosphohydrolase